MADTTHFDNGRWRIVVYRRPQPTSNTAHGLLGVYVENRKGNRFHPLIHLDGEVTYNYIAGPRIPQYIKRELRLMCSKRRSEKWANLIDYLGIA